MHKYLPSKKFILILSSIIVAVLIIWLAKVSINHFSESKVKRIESQQTAIQEFKDLDTDGDGLHDWEEALWKTDPNNPDTDGDGTADGEEIKDNRNPVVANTALDGQMPTDKKDEKLLATEKKELEDFNNLSATEKMSRTLLSTYLVTKNTSNGAPMTTQDEQLILGQALSTISTTSGAISDKYTLADIKTFTTTDTASLKQYGNRLGAITVLNSTVPKQNELTIIQEALATEDEEVLKKLDPIITYYKKTAADFIATPAPAEIANLHLAMINNLYKIQTSLEKIRNFFTDPVLGLSIIQNYDNLVLDFIKETVALKVFYIGKGVTFSTNEYGYNFINTI